MNNAKRRSELPQGNERTFAGLIFVAAMLAYANGYGGAFVYDDFHSIVDNESLRSLANLPRFFTDTTTFSALEMAGNYRPLLLVTYAINYAISGQEVWSYHLVNNLLHGISAALVFMLVCRLVDQVRRRNTSLPGTPEAHWLALPAATIFALHPIQSEAVNYINARSNLLCTTFYLLAATLFVHWRAILEDVDRDPRLRRWLPLLILCAGLLSAASKEVGLTLVVNLVAIEVLVFERSRSRFLASARRVYGPLLGAAIGFWLLRGELIARAAPEDTVYRAALPRSVGTNLMTQARVVAGYLRSILLPRDLSLDRHVATVETVGDPTFVAAALVLAGLAVVAVMSARRRPLTTLGLVWFAAALAPSSSFVVLNVVAAERRCYLAMAGLVMVVTSLLLAACARWGQTWASQRLSARLVAALLAAASVLACTPLTWARTELWRSELSLWQDAVTRYPQGSHLWTKLAESLGAADRVEEAIAAAERSVSLAPQRAEAYIALWGLYRMNGRRDDAQHAFWSAIEAPDQSFYLDMPAIASSLARLYQRQGRHDDAARAFRAVLRVAPDNPDALAGLGTEAARNGDKQQAATLFQRALEQRPDDLELKAKAGIVLHAAGRLSEAEALYAAVLVQQPDNHRIRYNLALVQDANGQLALALDNLRRVTEEQPDFYSAMVHLAQLLETKAGQPARAADLYRRALTLTEDEAVRRQIEQRLRRLSGGAPGR